MEVTKIVAIAGMEISKIESRINEKQSKQLTEKIRRAKRTCVCGAGRSLLMLRCFAIHLMHVGYDTYVMGNTATSTSEGGDLLIIETASGETTNLIGIADRAKSYGGTVVVCSIFPESSLGKRADAFVRIPIYTDKLSENGDNKKNILPSRSMFEISMPVLFDTMITPLAEEKGVTTNTYFARHANLG